MNKIIEIKFGSWLYGTNTPNSDLDFKAIYLPTAREICLNNYPKTITTCRPKRQFERNTKDDVDVEVLSLDRFMELLVQGQTMALDMLFASDDMITYSGDGEAIMEEIRANRNKFLNRNINAFVGYARQQAAKYGIKGTRVSAMREVLTFLSLYPESQRVLDIGHDAIYRWTCEINNEHIEIVELLNAQKTRLEPYLQVCNRKIPFHATIKYTKACFQKIFDQYGHRALLAEKNEGIDWKALSHAVRVNSEAQELLKTSHITFPRPDKDLLLEIKLGKLPYSQISDIIEKGLIDLEEAQKTSTLQESPDREWVNDFIWTKYREIVKNEH